MIKKLLYLIPTFCLLAACEDDTVGGNYQGNGGTSPSGINEHIIICNEGNWQSDNGQLSFFNGSTGTLTNQWFRKVNGRKLGDTPNDLLQINDTLIAIAVNYSNIIQYIHPDGTACGETENVPNNRHLCTDGQYLYVSSYAHQCGSQTFEKGFVAKINIDTKQVEATAQVGWEPEGIALYQGKLYVANSGGYAYAEGHEYETTIQVLDAATMQYITSINTGCSNLYGSISQVGKYLCIGAAGNYYNEPAHTIVLNCETNQFQVFNFASNCITNNGEVFYTFGTSYSYISGESQLELHTITPESFEVSNLIINEAISSKIQELKSPYALHFSKLTGNLYFTDANSYSSSGVLYGYSSQGVQLFEPQKLYVNPSHIITIPNSNQPADESWFGSQEVTVLEYHPAPGQYINTLPEAREGENHEQVCQRATQNINTGGMIHLGSLGGYVTIQFDHAVQNLLGSDFRILGNSFYAKTDPIYGTANLGGNIEPGIVYVGVGDNPGTCQWYELAGSEYYTSEQHNFGITYHKPITESASEDKQYIQWEAHWTDHGVQHDSVGFLPKNMFHAQSYWPLWEEKETISFYGGRLPNNAIDVYGNGTNWLLYRYSATSYGYADASLNDDIYSTFDIDWAVDAEGKHIPLKEVNFIRVASGLLQHCGSLGETSTEVAGFQDLHLVEGYDNNPIIIPVSSLPRSGYQEKP